MSFVEFLMDYYIYILIVLVLMIITVIGFLADKRDKKRKKEKKGDSVSTNANVGGETVQPVGDIAPTPLQPQSLDTNLNTITNIDANATLNSNVNSSNVMLNSGVTGQSAMEQPLIREDVPKSEPISNNSDVNSLGYKPLDEQKPKIAPRPVEIPSESKDTVNGISVNSAPVNPSVNPTQTMANSQPTMNTINPTPQMSQPVNPSVNANVVSPVQVTPVNSSVMTNSAPSINTNSVPKSPVVNSWDINPTPTVNPASATTSNAANLQGVAQSVNPTPSVNNVAPTPVQPNVNPTFGNVAQAPVAQQPASQGQSQDAGMNFVYGQSAPTNNQVNNNQDLWKL